MMRTDIDHLPPEKQRELKRIVEILHEEFDDALKLSTAEWKRRGRIQRIILFGSYTRGKFGQETTLGRGWVDEPHTLKGYLSDYDSSSSSTIRGSLTLQNIGTKRKIV